MKLNQQEREQHPIRAEQEEDTESKLMELHKQVQKLSCKNCHIIISIVMLVLYNYNQYCHVSIVLL